MSLRDALATPDALGDIITATVSAVAADGTVSLDFGGGRVVSRCPVLSTFTPGPGDSVQVLRRDSSSWLVLGTIRTSSPATVNVTASLSFPFNVLPATSRATPFDVWAAGSRSWRQDLGWDRATVVQGSPSAADGYHRGLYFYGDVIPDLAGRLATSLSITIVREAGGTAAAVPVYIAPHAHDAQPTGAPYFTADPIVVGTIAPGATLTFTLPTAWGQDLIDRKVKGFGHLYLGTEDYAVFTSPATVGGSGRLILGWS